MRTLLIFLFVAIVTLVFYNPTMDDFKDHIEAETRERERELAMSNMVGRMLSGEQVNMNTSLMGTSTERNNYLLLSTYKVSLTDADDTMHEWKYVGVGGFFFEMEAPADVDLNAAPGG
jgi:hypothetical protein